MKANLMAYFQWGPVYCKNYYFRMLDVNKMYIMTSKFIILYLNVHVFFLMIEW